jgi:superfamily II DNA or RNA helicase
MQTSPGEPHGLVWIRSRRWQIGRVSAETAVVRYDVGRGIERRTFLAPFDRPAALRHRERPVRVSRVGAIARLASAIGGSYGLDSLSSATRAAVDLYPYQLEPALAVLEGRRRLLIADAVGLGKTIQAGLVISEVLWRSPTARALVIAPAGLLDQWQSELITRFGIAGRRASPEDTPRTVDALTFGEDPWLLPGVWMGSADYLKQPHVLDTLPLAPWDLVIVDEAHGSAGASDRHAAVHAICQRARHVLLLSATPHSGNQADFDRLQTLGDIGVPGDRLLIFQRSHQAAGRIVNRRVRRHIINPRASVRRLFTALEDFERTVIAAARRTHREDAGALFISVLWRRAVSTIPALVATLSHRLAWLESLSPSEDERWRQGRLDFDDLDLMSADERLALSNDVGLPADRERREITTLTHLAEAATPDDPKLLRLHALAARTADALVVFTEFRRSLEAAAIRLESCRAIATLHGGMSAAERRHELGRFLGGPASLLIATDVAGQGLNLQSKARWVVNLDLPWSPARLEQRIGRVDRIGQRRAVHLSLLTVAHRADRRLSDNLTRRVQIARGAFGPSQFETFAPGLGSSLASVPADAGADGGPRHRSAWTTRARAVALVLSAKRSQAKRWQSPTQTENRPVLAASARCLGCSKPRGWLLGFRVEIVDGTGTVTEARFVVVRASLEPGQEFADAVAEGRLAASRHLGPRLRRVQRMTAQRAREREAIDAALETHLAALAKGREVQLMLFHKAHGGSSTHERVLAEAAWRTANHIALLRQTADVRLTAPALKWIWAL